jgi:hypothetical protein
MIINIIIDILYFINIIDILYSIIDIIIIDIIIIIIIKSFINISSSLISTITF